MQPRCEQFENNIYDQLIWKDPSKRIWIENESRSIGKVFIPDCLFEKFRQSPMIMVERSFDYRVGRSVQEYGQFEVADLIFGFEKIQKRLGGQHALAAIEALNNGKLSTACIISLKYYDKAYDNSTKVNGYSSCQLVNGTDMQDEELTNKLISTANKNGISTHAVQSWGRLWLQDFAKST